MFSFYIILCLSIENPTKKFNILFWLHAAALCLQKTTNGDNETHTHTRRTNAIHLKLMKVYRGIWVFCFWLSTHFSIFPHEVLHAIFNTSETERGNKRRCCELQHTKYAYMSNIIIQFSPNKPRHDDSAWLGLCSTQNIKLCTGTLQAWWICSES